MTSVLRNTQSTRSLPAAPGFVAAYFTNSDGFSQPFPWRFNKQTGFLDLEFVDGFTNSTSLSDDPMFFRGQQFGGINLVMGLGPSFIEWCENTGDIDADAGTVELVEKPIVASANLVAPNQDPNSGESQEQSYPISFESAAGSSEGQYCKTLVFMKPLVISYMRSGTKYYRWISQNFEGNT
jgi:hypothetical protein